MDIHHNGIYKYVSINKGNMEFWRVIIACLWDEGVDAGNENDLLVWEAEKGSFSIKYKDVAFDGDKLAWFQEEEYGKCLIRIKLTNGIIISWNPIVGFDESMIFNLHFIKWFGDRLIVIFEEDDQTKVIQIENLSITVLYAGIPAAIEISGETIYLRDYLSEDIVHAIFIRKKYASATCFPATNLKQRRPEIELSSYLNYFSQLDGNYNKGGN